MWNHPQEFSLVCVPVFTSGHTAAVKEQMVVDI